MTEHKIVFLPLFWFSYLSFFFFFNKLLFEMNTNDDRLTFLLPRPVWVNDMDVSYCSSCNNAFGPLKRRVSPIFFNTRDGEEGM